MDSSETLVIQSAPPPTGNLQLVIISRLLQNIEHIQHIDEFLLWLSQMFIKRLDIRVVQFWTAQEPILSTQPPELRIMARQNPLLQPRVVANAQVAALATRVLKGRRGILPRAVTHTFSRSQADLLISNNLNYWACYHLSNNASLPPPYKDHINEKMMTPLRMAVSLFFQHKPQPRMITTFSYILEQAISIAKNRGLLLPNTPTIRIPAYSPQGHTTQNLPSLTEMIPRLSPTSNHGQLRNPFSNTALATDTLARRLYLVIDGQRNVAELGRLTHMSISDIKTSLRTLLLYNYIQLDSPDKQTVTGTHLLQPARPK